MSTLVETMVFDDDQLLNQLTEDILIGLGYSCRHFLDGRSALQQIREAQPRLIVMDIMMPGMDGLSICRQIKADPALKELKIIIFSSKDSPAEKARALKAGADAFLLKPYDVTEFKELVGRLAGPPEQAQAAPAKAVLRLQVWGCRGYSAAPVKGVSSFGVHTSCVSVQAASGELIILDAGSGLVPCAASLAAKGLPGQITLLLTHYHMDHIQGLAGVDWAAQAGLTLKVFGPQDQDVDLGKLLQQYLAKGQPPKAALTPAVLYEDSYRLSPTVTLSVLYAQHPTTTLVFSLDISGKKIVYCPDSDIPEEEGITAGDYEEKLTRFTRGADVFIYNAHLSPEERAEGKQSGYSSWKGALRVAVEASVRQLVLFHHNPDYSDEKLRALDAAVQEAVKEEMTTMKCVMAVEGLSLEL